MTESIPLKHYHFLGELVSLPFVEAVYLFGSRARGDHRERSDIDLAVFCPKASAQDWLQVLAIVERADTLLTIDCVRLDAEPANSPLRAAIERDKKVLYER
ncbi:DNA polymerase beta domain-containing protein [Oceanimonas sp. GK1]|uniref:nucleotidyltransferase domain-containing protein n=1 Tax=Oceanimonas sp. (strain GK1 / IBRC-M 10197) TaxID=511062 RepID=UPI00024951C4|nr:nucleotidyltransferase domain-containing protein [Oceanimonas sp. GK1]AEY02312.1 DNA polymerase beta domain-containing protein [Oceanimonas sp. GK1]